MKKPKAKDADRRESSGTCLAAPASKNPVPCSHCNGTGREPLSVSMMDILAALTVNDELDASEVARKNTDAISVNAFSNRLRKLHDAGYLLRRKSGKRWLYRRAG